VREHDGITFQVYRAGDSRWCFGRRARSSACSRPTRNPETVIQLAYAKAVKGVKRPAGRPPPLIVAVVGWWRGRVCRIFAFTRESTNEIRLREREIAGSRVPVRPQRGAGAMHETERVLVSWGNRRNRILIAHLLLQSAVPRSGARPQSDSGGTRLGSAVESCPATSQPHTLSSAVRTLLTSSHRRGGHRLCARATHRRHRYKGVLNVLGRRSAGGTRGSFLYMTAIGVITPSLQRCAPQPLQGQHAAWRRRVEDDIRASGVDYTIIRAGVLLISLVRSEPLKLARATRWL